MKNLLILILVIFLLGIAIVTGSFTRGYFEKLGDLRQSEPVHSNEGNTSSSNTSVQIAHTNTSLKKELIEVINIKFHAWWWSLEQVHAGIDGDNPPPKESYTELRRWRYDGEGVETYPDKIDIEFEVLNNTNKSIPVIITATADFKIENYKKVQVYVKDDEPQSEYVDPLANVPWTRSQEIDNWSTTIISKSKDKFKVKDFNLRKLLKEYKGEEWPWVMRLKVYVKNDKGEEVAYQEKQIEIIPGD